MLVDGKQVVIDGVLGRNDILITAPYNMQVNRLQTRLGNKARIGTVDKFQGQEAPVAIHSLTASDGDSAPRGIDFLLDPNRLNVAISRASAYRSWWAPMSWLPASAAASPTCSGSAGYAA